VSRSRRSHNSVISRKAQKSLYRTGRGELFLPPCPGFAQCNNSLPTGSAEAEAHLILTGHFVWDSPSESGPHDDDPRPRHSVLLRHATPHVTGTMSDRRSLCTVWRCCRRASSCLARGVCDRAQPRRAVSYFIRQMTQPRTTWLVQSRTTGSYVVSRYSRALAVSPDPNRRAWSVAARGASGTLDSTPTEALHATRTSTACTSSPGGPRFQCACRR
jgi:hypothetical protein